MEFAFSYVLQLIETELFCKSIIVMLLWFVMHVIIHKIIDINSNMKTESRSHSPNNLNHESYIFKNISKHVEFTWKLNGLLFSFMILPLALTTITDPIITTNPGKGYSTSWEITGIMIAGHLTYEFILCISHYNVFKWSGFMHGFAGMTGGLASLLWPEHPLGYWASACAMFELTTPITVLRWFLLKYHLTDTLLFTIVQWSTMITYVLVRLIFGNMYVFPTFWKYVFTIGLDSTSDMPLIRYLIFLSTSICSFTVNILWTISLIRSTINMSQVHRVSMTSNMSKTINISKAEITKKITSLFQQRLGIACEDIDVNASFSDLGINSLIAVQMTRHMSDFLEIPLDLTVMFRYGTIDKFANAFGNDGVQSTCLTNKSNQRKIKVSKIDVIGIACRAPGADNVSELWDIIYKRRDAISMNPPEGRGGYPGGYIKDIFAFDNKFFNIKSIESDSMSLSQRQCLEVSWLALEDAGIDPLSLAGTNVGVYVGVSDSEPPPIVGEMVKTSSSYHSTGCAKSVCANRISHILDIRGPSMIVDTACSSGLVAIHTASAALKAGDCDLAIVGGVNVLVPDVTYILRKSGFLSKDNRCKTFAAGANGYVRAEACGFVILRRAGDKTIGALLQNNKNDCKPYAQLVGTALNQDGKGYGLTAPNPAAQETVMRKAYRSAGIMPSDIAYIEAHGTGTSLGDAIEAQSIGAVLADGGIRNQLCPVGSIKSNIGHTEAAAGIMGFIKAVLMCKKNIIPASLLHGNLENESINFRSNDIPLFIPNKNSQLIENCANKSHPYIGVSSFGFGGCNAHVVLQPIRNNNIIIRQTKPVRSLSLKDQNVLFLSAKSRNAFKELVIRINDFLVKKSYNDHIVESLCATLIYRRPQYKPYVWKIQFSSATTLRSKLLAAVKQIETGSWKHEFYDTRKIKKQSTVNAISLCDLIYNEETYTNRWIRLDFINPFNHLEKSRREPRRIHACFNHMTK